MRIRLSTLLLLVTVIALGIALFIKNRQPTFYEISNYADYWIVEEKQLDLSTWIDTSKPPPISQKQAVEIGMAVTECFNPRNKELKCKTCRLESVSLTRIDRDRPVWAYEIFIQGAPEEDGYWLEFTFLLLLDGSIAVDRDMYRPTVIEVLDEYALDSGIEVLGVSQGTN